MIKLQEFAKTQGVTDRAVQKQLKRYEEQLQGHFARKGPAGTWLDEYAQEFLRQHMQTKSLELLEANEQILQLRQELEEMRCRAEAAEKKCVALESYAFTAQ